MFIGIPSSRFLRVIGWVVEWFWPLLASAIIGTVTAIIVIYLLW